MRTYQAAIIPTERSHLLDILLPRNITIQQHKAPNSPELQIISTTTKHMGQVVHACAIVLEHAHRRPHIYEQGCLPYSILKTSLLIWSKPK